MKALTLHQPWASFIAAGIKPFETRSWAPRISLIGQRIAIHAGKRKPDSYDAEWARNRGISDLPLGAVVCTAILYNAYLCGGDDGTGSILIARKLDETKAGRRFREDEYGDYAEGRWAWHLTDVRRLYPPISVRGAQRLWDWADHA